MRHFLFIFSMAVIPTIAMAGNKLNYPSAPKSETIDRYFDLTVRDRFRPLENDTSQATEQWVAAENKLTREYLDAIPFRSELAKRLTELNNYTKRSLPYKLPDGRYYYYNNDGLRNQSVLYRAATPDQDGEVFLDPNTLSEDGTVALTGFYMSPDGKYTAYTISRSGSDWTEIYVMDTETRELLKDHIMWAKFTGAQWDGDGFYYSAYDAPEPGKEYSNANHGHKVFYHRLGTDQTEDIVAFEDKDAPLHFHSAWVDEDGKILTISVGGQGNGNGLITKSLKTGGDWVVVADTQDKYITPVGVIGDSLLLYTSVDAEKYRLVKAPVTNPRKENWVEIVPEGENVLTSVDIAGDRLILTYDIDASNHAYVYTHDGVRVGEIKLPTFGTIGLSTDTKSPEVFYSFSSFAYPSARYKYDMATGESTPIGSAEIKGFNSEDYITEQIFYPSADGTMIPMFITYKRGLERDGSNPVYLYGYGGFNITLNPGFSANRVLWLENGGIYAQANLRGGAEYGEPWHLAGTKMQKLNVFNDFIAAGEYLINQGWTKPELLTIEGGSNGGLLVGACVNMRPDLFAVAIPRVGVMDMMRYHLFTIGWNWAHDYGTSADSPEMARYLLDYSPMHNIQNDGTPYPAIMVTTADHDDRVVPAHSFKYAAELQDANTGDKPKLIRIDSKAGHGSGKPISKVIDEYADIYSFILFNLGLTPKSYK